MRNTIYAIEMLEKLECDDNGWPNFGSTNPIGFYMKKKDAFEDVEKNALDIRECAYNYALIEKIREGLYPSSHERWFFKWNDETKKYEQIEEPLFLNRFSGFIM